MMTTNDPFIDDDDGGRLIRDRVNDLLALDKRILPLLMIAADASRRRVITSLTLKQGEIEKC